MMLKRLVIGILLLITVLEVVDLETGGPAVLGAYFEQVFAPMGPGGPAGPEAGPGSYGDARSYAVSGKLTGSAQGVSAFSVDNRRGSVAVTGSSSDRIDVEYTVTVYADSEETAKRYTEELKPALKAVGSVLSLAVGQRELPFSSGVRGIQIDYAISIPKGMGLKVVNAVGPVRVTGMGSDVTIQNRFGPATVADVRGDVDVECAVGYTEVTNVYGNLNLNNRNQGSRVSNVKGSVTASVQVGNLDVEQVAGNVVASIVYGNTSIEGVSGSAEVHSSVGDLAISNVKGPVTGDSRFGAISVSGISNSSRLVARNGSISVELARGAGGYKLDATVRNGRITTNLPLQVVRSEAERKERLEGSIDGGRFDIKLVSEYGDIDITMK
ncbi:MAG: hypothetical protein ACM309_11105 [Bacillota bacterium]